MSLGSFRMLSHVKEKNYIYENEQSNSQLIKMFDKHQIYDNNI